MTDRKASILSLLPLAGLLPLLAEAPYLASTWRHSPLDRLNWLLLLAALLGGVAGHLLLPARCRKAAFDARALWVVGMGVSLLSLAWFLRIHAFCQLAACLLTWGLAWLVHGWEYAWKSLPLLIVGLLGVTGALYWLDFMLGPLLSIGKGIHLALGGLCCLWWLVQLHWNYCPPVSGLLFGLLVAGGLALGTLQTGETHTAPPHILTPGPDTFSPALGREIPPSDNDRRFFAGCRCSRWCFASAEQPEKIMELLAVENIGDVHSIHPARHCLRVSGFRLLEAKVLNVAPDDAPPLYVEEVSVDDAGGNTLYGWIWYSSSALSTPSYVLFRLKWRSAPLDWHAYQLFVNERDIEAGRRILQSLLFGRPAPGQ